MHRFIRPRRTLAAIAVAAVAVIAIPTLSAATSSAGTLHGTAETQSAVHDGDDAHSSHDHLLGTRTGSRSGLRHRSSLPARRWRCSRVIPVFPAPCSPYD